MFSWEATVPSTQIAIYLFSKKDKSLKHFFLVLPCFSTNSFRRTEEQKLSPIFLNEILVSFRPRNCEVAQKPQRKHKQREQADQQKLGVLRSSRDSANTWSPELWMKSGAGILGLGYFYPPLHKPLPYTS